MEEERKPIQFAFSGFSLDQVNILLAGLKELPAKLSYDLIAGITSAANQQIEQYNKEVEQTSE